MNAPLSSKIALYTVDQSLIPMIVDSFGDLRCAQRRFFDLASHKYRPWIYRNC